MINFLVIVDINIWLQALNNDRQVTKDKSFTLEEIWKPIIEFLTYL
jgi:hypothetical protein